MKISKKSWHYKFMKIVLSYQDNGFKEPNTLCGYFWSFVGAVVMFLIAIGLGSLTGLVFILYPLMELYFYTFYTMPEPMETSAFWLLIGEGLLITAIGLALAITKWHEYYRYDMKQETKNKLDDFVDKPLSFFSMVFEYIGAKKRKICPFIKYED